MPKRITPNPQHPCYDCGSTIPNHHTPLCEFAPEGSIRDLPQRPKTQWWDKTAPLPKGVKRPE